jgi:hypothetical protein
MMRHILLGVVFAAFLLMGVLPGVALALPPAEAPKPPVGTFTVTCPTFETGHGLFTQRLPTPALFGNNTSVDHTRQIAECE